MSVYVDNMRANYGRMKMCHMVADSTDELLSMVDRIGVNRQWMQDAGTYREHFDIALSKAPASCDIWRYRSFHNADRTHYSQETF